MNISRFFKKISVIFQILLDIIGTTYCHKGTNMKVRGKFVCKICTTCGDAPFKAG